MNNVANSQTENQMTVREMRQMLFEVDQQEMTVRELRQLLTSLDEQDEEFTSKDMSNVTRRAQQEKQNALI